MPELADETWSTRLRHATFPAAKFIEGAKPYRQYFREEILGNVRRPAAAAQPAHPAGLRQAEMDRLRGGAGRLPGRLRLGRPALPKDIKPGERRPVVVCQHGRNGLPKDVIEGDTAGLPRLRGPAGGARASSPSRRTTSIAARTATAAQPQGATRSSSRCSRSSSASTSRSCAGWRRCRSSTPSRIAFYGLSYGGETAVRVPAAAGRLLPVDLLGRLQRLDAKGRRHGQRLQLHVHHRVGDALLQHGQHVQLRGAGLPDGAAAVHGRARPPRRRRPGRVGGLGVRQGALAVRNLGLGDRTEIEFFNGGHTINGEGTFRFLRKHLRLG